MNDPKVTSQKFSEESYVGSANSVEALSEFKAADFIVHPPHGVGQIISIEKQTIAGASLDLFAIYFAKSKMTVRVPVRRAASLGLRRPSDSGAIQEAKRVLSDTPRKGHGNWPKPAQEYESKIKSGDIIAIAEVVRDLFRLGAVGQSFSERQIYSSALDRLCGEVALVSGVTEHCAFEELEGLLKASSHRAAGMPRRSWI